MRILTWNINGIRTVPQYYPWNTLKDHDEILNHLQADIICFQEMKTSRAGLTKSIALPPSFDGFFSFPVRKSGYSGVATYTRSTLLVPHKAEEGLCGTIQPKPPLSPSERVSRPSAYPDAVLSAEDADTLDFKDLDSEGRVIVVDLGLFVLINVYCPNDGNGTEERDKYKMKFHKILSARVQGLVEVEGREVIVVGDLNACAAVEDHCEGPLYARRGQAEGKKGDEGFWEKDSRKWLKNWLIQEDEHGNVTGGGCMVDIVRRHWPGRAGMYTCWNTKISARDSNYGTRIDYILITRGLLPWVKAADIQPDIKGSDHCPVFMDLHDEITTESGGVLKLVDLLRVPKHEKASQPNLVPLNLPLPSPPRLAARLWDEYSGKQKMLDTFFRKKSGTGDPSPTPSQAPEPPSSQSQSQPQSSSQVLPSPLPTPSPPTQAVQPPLPSQPTSMPTGNNPFPKSLAETLSQAFTASATPIDVSRSPPPTPGVKRKLTATPSAQASSSAKKLKAQTLASKIQDKDEGKKKKVNGQMKLSTFFAKPPKPKLGSSSKEDTIASTSSKAKGKAKAKDAGGQGKDVGSKDKEKGKSKASSSKPPTTAQPSTQSSRASSPVDLTLLSDDDDDIRECHPPSTQPSESCGGDMDVDVDLDASEGESDYGFALRLAHEDDEGSVDPPSSSLPSSTKTPSSSQNGSGNGGKDPVIAWTTLMAPIQPPDCLVHGEPAKEFTVMKPGPNKGKTFFICSRPVGPGYDAGRSFRLREEVDHQWKCNFFKWSSEVRKEMNAKTKQSG
ncbi:DNase I-like protein [Pluteus cervinus]|uniref:DNase I-like protein n=1 Tax=Pluteus cervinus TaxID=181527 RepID=A0ACD3AGE7_9AGAR|nr:DNase I-like protein [Pluteus cervinus]